MGKVPVRLIAEDPRHALSPLVEGLREVGTVPVAATFCVEGDDMTLVKLEDAELGLDQRQWLWELAVGTWDDAVDWCSSASGPLMRAKEVQSRRWLLRLLDMEQRGTPGWVDPVDGELVQALMWYYCVVSSRRLTRLADCLTGQALRLARQTGDTSRLAELEVPRVPVKIEFTPTPEYHEEINEARHGAVVQALAHEMTHGSPPRIDDVGSLHEWARGVTDRRFGFKDETTVRGILKGLLSAEELKKGPRLRVKLIVEKLLEIGAREMGQAHPLRASPVPEGRADCVESGVPPEARLRLGAPGT